MMMEMDVILEEITVLIEMEKYIIGNIWMI